MSLSQTVSSSGRCASLAAERLFVAVGGAHTRPIDFDVLPIDDQEALFTTPAIAFFVLSSLATFAGELADFLLHDELQHSSHRLDAYSPTPSQSGSASKMELDL